MTIQALCDSLWISGQRLMGACPDSVVGQFGFPQLCSSTKNRIPVFLSDSEGALRPEGESKDRENISFVHTASGSSTDAFHILRCLREAIEQSQADHR